MKKISIAFFIASMAICCGCSSSDESLNANQDNNSQKTEQEEDPKGPDEELPNVELSKDFQDSWETGKYFCYASGKKHELQINTRYVFVTSTNINAVVGSDACSANPIDFGVKYDIKEVKEQPMKNLLDGKQIVYYWAELELLEDLDEATYKKKIDQLRMSNNEIIVSPCFRISSSKKIGLSNFLSVKLKTANDIAKLKAVAAKTKVTLLEGSANFPLWYIISLTPQSEKNALDMANWYHESNLFQYAEPDLMEDALMK